MIAVGAGAVAAPPHPDQELLATLALFDEIERAILAHWSAGPAYIADEDARLAADDPLQTLQRPLLEGICTLQARTPEGWRARARTLLLYDQEMAGNIAAGDDATEYSAERMVQALVRDLTTGAA